jgi:hypothetical protein
MDLAGRLQTSSASDSVQICNNNTIWQTWFGMSDSNFGMNTGNMCVYAGVVKHFVHRASGVHLLYCKAHIPCVDVLMTCVLTHASGTSAFLWLCTQSSHIYTCTKLYWRGVNAKTCAYMQNHCTLILNRCNDFKFIHYIIALIKYMLYKINKSLTHSNMHRKS